MVVKSGFFMSVNGDRRYDAAFFAEYFASFIGNGVFPNPSTNLQVVEGSNMQTIVKQGKGWINGYYVHNDSDYVMQHDIADGVLKRIDRIVLQWNYLTRQIVIVVKKGTFASSPVAPVLVRNTDYYELALADVYITNGATQITQANITDQRLNTSLCGIVHGTVNQVDTTTLFNQYQSWINQQKALYTQELELWTADQRLSFEQWMATQHSDFANWRQLEEQEFMDWMLMQQASFNNWMMQEQTDFEAWVATLEDLLDENIAATLTAKIVTLEQNFEAHENELASTSKTGHVQLNDTVTSASTTQAATANAVKQVNDAVTQVNDALTTHTDDFTSHVRFGVTSEADAKTITLTPAPTSLSMGFAVAFANTVANTGAVTLNVNNLGAVPVLNAKGEQLKAGALQANSICTVRYNNGNFILQGDGGGDSFDYDKTLEGLNAVRDMSTMYTRNATPLGAIGIGEDCVFATHVSSGLGQYYSIPDVTISNGYLISNANAIYVVDGQDKILVLATNYMYILGDKGSTQIALASMGLSNQKWFNKSGQLSTDGGDNVFIIDNNVIKKVSMIDASIIKQSANVGSSIADLCVDVENQCLYIIGYDKRIKKYTFDLVEVWNTPGNWTIRAPHTETNQRIALGPLNEVLVCFVVSGSSNLMFGRFRSTDGGVINSRYNQLASVSTITSFTSLAMYGGYLMYFDPLAYYTINYNNFDYLSIHQVSYPQTGQLDIVTPSRDGKHVVAAYRQSSGSINISTLKYKVLQQ